MIRMLRIFILALCFTPFIASAAHAQEALLQMNADEFHHYVTEVNPGIVVLLPTASWCSLCRGLEGDYVKAAEDLKADSITVVRMDYDQNRDFMQALGIQQLPQTEIYVNGVRRWEYKGGMHELRLVYEVKQAQQAVADGSFQIKSYTLLKPIKAEQ